MIAVDKLIGLSQDFMVIELHKAMQAMPFVNLVTVKLLWMYF